MVNSHNKVLLRIAPNAFPCSKVLARREPGDEGLIEFVQVGGHSGDGCGAPAVMVVAVNLTVAIDDVEL